MDMSASESFGHVGKLLPTRTCPRRKFLSMSESFFRHGHVHFGKLFELQNAILSASDDDDNDDAEEEEEDDDDVEGDGDGYDG